MTQWNTMDIYILMARIVCLIPSAQVFLIYWGSWTEIDLFTGLLGMIGDDVDLI